MHQRTIIRTELKAVLDQRFSDVSVEINRAHASSKLPLINIMSGLDERDIEQRTREGAPSRYFIRLEVRTASIDDKDIDDILEVIEQAVRDKARHRGYWESLFINAIEEPETVAGEKKYTTTTIILQANYQGY